MLATLLAAVCGRMTLGRPYLVTFAVLLTILFLWQKHGSLPPKWWMLLLATTLFTLDIFVHGVWYLWVLPLGAFLLAGQVRWAFSLGCCWAVGVFIGSALTGHPFEYPLQALKLAFLAVGAHATTRTMATELQPFDGNILAVVILGGLLVLRQLAKLNTVPLTKNPAFWLRGICWVLGFNASRFWDDWGWPALMVLMTCDLQCSCRARFAENSFRRLGLTLGLAAATFLCVTNDAQSRWSQTLSDRYLTADEQPDLDGWLPDKGGFFIGRPDLFYQTFFKNPTSDWRYVVGFEPTLMPREDFEVYHSVLWNLGDTKAYAPWIKKMQPADRLVVRGGRGASPGIPQLEWNYSGVGIWVGRLPRTPASGPPRPFPPRLPADIFAGHSLSNCRASAKSFSVRPPASCVVSVSVTLFQRMSMSGWCHASSARPATASTNWMAAGKSLNWNVREITSPFFCQSGIVASADLIWTSASFFTAQHRSLAEKIKTIRPIRKCHRSFGGLLFESASRGGTFCGFLRSAALACSTKLTQVVIAHSQLKPKHAIPHFSIHPGEFFKIVSPFCAW